MCNMHLVHNHIRLAMLLRQVQPTGSIRRTPAHDALAISW